MNALIDLTKCREYLTINMGGRDHQIRLCGTIEDPYFCGRDVCEVLGYKDPKNALFRYVDFEDKKNLKELGFSLNENPNYLGRINHNITHNEGQVPFISEAGLYSLINGSQNFKNKKELKQQIEKWIVDIRYGEGSGLMDIFTFVKGYNLAFDITSDWFQDLWYPLSKSNPALQGGVRKVENRPIILTQNILKWMGYKGRDQSDKQKNFCKLLRNLEIPYDEIGYDHSLALEYPCVQHEARLIPKQLNQKKWISMDIKAFKKAVLRLNTENAEVVRDYYLNLEEAMFAYGEYTMNYLIEKTERTRKIQDSQLAEAVAQLAIKEAEEEVLQKQLEQEKEARVKAERKAIRVNKFMKRITIKEKKMEWIYIATNRYYAIERLWKIGCTIRLSSRIGTYNTGRAKGLDDYYYVWAIKCYNSKDVDAHIQKLLADFKWNDPKAPIEHQNKENRSEMYHGIKFTDLKEIVAFIVNNYDASIDYINKFIKTRLETSLEEEDEVPLPLDYKRLTYQIGDHTETIDLEEEESDTVREALEDILTGLKEQYARQDESVVVVHRKDLIDRLSDTTNTAKKDLWSQIKELTGWTNSKTEIDNLDGLKYKIVY
jgi:MSV199 domain/BRO family, N-terminal domain/T5orf172 domain